MKRHRLRLSLPLLVPLAFAVQISRAAEPESSADVAASDIDALNSRYALSVT